MLFKKLIDVLTLGSEHPVKRLIAYYTVLVAVMVLLATFFPTVDRLLGGQGPSGQVMAGELLTDGLAGAAPPAAEIASKRIELAITTVAMLLGALLLMLPVTWVYMSTKASNQGHNQQVAQTLIFLPIVVAGIVMVVQNSLALAFSLAGVVAAVRFRTTLRDSRDVVYVFLSIAVGFAAGIHNLIVAAIVSAVFNFVLIMTWRYDFGRNVLQPTAAGHWGEPLKELAATAVVALPLGEASVKTRSGPPVDEDHDVAAGGWAGVLPLRVVAGLVETVDDASPQVPPADVRRRADRLRDPWDLDTEIL